MAFGNTDFIVNAGVQVLGTAVVSSSTNQSGTLQVNGGASIAKNIVIGSTASIYGPAEFYNTVNVSGTINLSNLSLTGIITSTNLTTATTDAGGTGAIVLQGGAYIGNNLVVMSTVSNTSTAYDNAVYVNGGVYIKKDLTVEGPTLFKDTVVFGGTATYVLSSNTVYTDNILELHVPPGGVDNPWTLDDGKDIGIRIHYYATTDTNAAFLFSNNSKKFEFYQSGAEGTSTFSNGVYAGIQAGSLRLANTTSTFNTSTGALVVEGGVGIAGDIFVGNNISGGFIAGRNLSDNRIPVVGSNGVLYDYANLTFNTSTGVIQGIITTASFSYNATTATNIAGGSTSSLVYQTAPGTTNFIALGSSTYVLTSDGSSPYWAPVGNAGNASTADSISGGQTGQIPFQTAPSQTGFNSALIFSTNTNSLLINGGNTSTGNINVSGNISSSSTIFTNYLRVTDNSNSTSTVTGAITIVGGIGIGQNANIGGDITVGAVTTNSSVSILNGNNLNLSSYTKTNIVGSSLINLDSYDGTVYRSSKYFVQIVDGSNVHVTEMSIFHDGITAYKTEYGFHNNSGILGSFGATYTASTVTLTFQPVNAIDMTVKIIRWSITV